MRTCLVCRDDWPADAEFYDRDALVCHACISEGASMQRPSRPRTRGYRTPDQIRQHQRAKYLRHRDAYLARMRDYYAAHRDEINASRRATRAMGRLIDC
jgi:hypothetical protein